MTGQRPNAVPRRWRWLAWAPLSFLLSLAQAVEPAQEVVVIAHGAFAAQSLTPAELALIFRRTETIDARGSALVPVNLPGTHPLRVAFSRALFRLDPADMEAYWNERYFHGVAPPHVVASVEAMLRCVAATEGAIGYVPACAVDARVKVVAHLNARDVDSALQCP